jgi:hypothetical protein
MQTEDQMRRKTKKGEEGKFVDDQMRFEGEGRAENERSVQDERMAKDKQKSEDEEAAMMQQPVKICKPARQGNGKIVRLRRKQVCP